MADHGSVWVVPPVLPLSREQFRAALHKGQGRALMHVAQHGEAGIEDCIVDACIRNQAYDPQCEEGRGTWLVEILDASGHTDQLRERILAGFADAGSPNRSWDLSQLCEIACCWAKRGDDAARTALYRALEKNDRLADLIGGEEIVELDGADGLVHVAECLGRWLRDDPALYVDAPLAWYDDRHGDGSALQVLQCVAAGNVYIRTYLDAVCDASHSGQEYELNAPDAGRMRVQDWRPSDGAADAYRWRMRAISVERILAEIQTTDPEHSPYWYSSWGRQATDDELLEITAVMFDESHPGRLCKYLRVFFRHPLPQFDPRLVDLLARSEPDVRWAVLRVLANHEHADVRSVALARIERGAIDDGTLALFTKNYRSGDHLRIERALRPLKDRDDAHTVALDLVRVFEANKTPCARNAMVFAYEHSPCANCRQDAVRILRDCKTVPDWIVEECRYDADPDIRALFPGDNG